MREGIKLQSTHPNIIRGTTYPNPESGLLTLRQRIKAYANIRPCTFYSRSLIHLSSLKPSVIEDVDFVILRENCGGAYFGPKTEEENYASDAWGYSRPEIERVARVAAALALQHDPPLRVTSSDKANVLASGRLWRKVITELFEQEFPQIELRHQLADSLAMIMIKDPCQLNGVVVTDNTFGDMLSDEAGGLTGSLGLLPSASLCGIPPTRGEQGKKGVNGIYEPIHGSAPDIAGKGIANPIAQILSVALMLRYSFGLLREADLVEAAVETVLDGHDMGGLETRTPDLGGKAGTAEVGDAVAAVLQQLFPPEPSKGMGATLTVPGLAPGRSHVKRLSAMFRESIPDRPRTAHKDENLEWERQMEGLPPHEPLAL